MTGSNGGLDPTRRRLFVIDGSKALRRAIDEVFGSANPVQRCRNHKLRNVLGHLPKDQHDPVKAAIRAAWKLETDDGMAKLESLARWIERDQPSAAESLREGLSDMFTINRLGLPARLRKCLGTTNVIDSTHAGVRQKTRTVTNWKNGTMATRWAAASFVETEKSYRRIIGYHQLSILKAHLDDLEPVAEMNEDPLIQPAPRSHHLQLSSGQLQSGGRRHRREEGLTRFLRVLTSRQHSN